MMTGGPIPVMMVRKRRRTIDERGPRGRRKVVAGVQRVLESTRHEGICRALCAGRRVRERVGMWWKGRAEIKAAHEFTHSTMFKSSRLTILETSVRFPAPQLAIARSRWLLENHVGPDGEPLPARHGVLVNVLARQGGRWLIIDAQNTDIIDGVVSRPQ